MCYERHAKHQEEATREDPEWQEQYADFKESELQAACFAMMQFFDPVSYEQQAEDFAEEQKKLKAKQLKKQKKKKEKEAAVKKCHDLGLSVWDQAALTKWDGPKVKAQARRMAQAEPAEQTSRSAIEEFLQTEEGKTLLTSMDYEYVAGDSGLRELLAVESDKYMAEKTRANKLEQAVRQVQTVGSAILTVIRSVAPAIEIQPEWTLAFDRTQPVESPMRARPAASSARPQSSLGAGSSGSARRPLQLEGRPSEEPGSSSQDFYFES